MAYNLENRNEKSIDFDLYWGDYWDLYLTDHPSFSEVHDTIISGSPLISQFDFNDERIYSSGSTSAQTITSIDEWDEAINEGVNNDTIGYTGIDNGFIIFDKTSGDTGNTALISAITESDLVIPSGDTKFFMNAITGTSGDYIYPLDIKNETGSTVGDFAKLCGGFYQGFYKLKGYDYQTLPNRYEEGWTSEFWLRKRNDCDEYSGRTLNDEYPENKGFFFYMGTRAENKFWNIFEGLNTGSCSSNSATTFCTEVKETDVMLTKHVRLSPPKQNIRTIENQFLIYHRANDGFGLSASCDDSSGDSRLASNFTGDSITVAEDETKLVNGTNPFLKYHRANDGFGLAASCDDSSGESGLASNFSGFTKPIKELDKEADLIDNAIGFRIKDDGSVGYRKLSLKCITTGETNYTALTVEEKYSEETPVKNDKWTHIAIKFNPYKKELGSCQLPSAKRKGKLIIYVNGRLKLSIRDFDEFYTRDLDEHFLKQVGVPHNMSIGGGSQGLIDSQTFDGPDPEDKNLPIEKNFAGTFIGDISKFRLYDRSLNWCEIKNNINKEKDKYGLKFPIKCS